MNIMDILQWLITAVSLIFGGTSVLMWRLDRRKKSAEVKKDEINVEEIQDEYFKKTIKSAFEQLNTMRDIESNLRSELIECTRQKAEAEIAKAEAEAEAAKWKAKYEHAIKFSCFNDDCKNRELTNIKDIEP